MAAFSRPQPTLGMCGESGNRELAQVFESELTDRQRQILARMGLDPATYAREK
jgi:hypothetical protein